MSGCWRCSVHVSHTSRESTGPCGPEQCTRSLGADARSCEGVGSAPGMSPRALKHGRLGAASGEGVEIASSRSEAAVKAVDTPCYGIL
jgi:hypothetical protein